MFYTFFSLLFPLFDSCCSFRLGFTSVKPSNFEFQLPYKLHCVYLSDTFPEIPTCIFWFPIHFRSKSWFLTMHHHKTAHKIPSPKKITLSKFYDLSSILFHRTVESVKSTYSGIFQCRLVIMWWFTWYTIFILAIWVSPGMAKEGVASVNFDLSNSIVSSSIMAF